LVAGGAVWPASRLGSNLSVLPLGGMMAGVVIRRPRWAAALWAAAQWAAITTAVRQSIASSRHLAPGGIP